MAKVHYSTIAAADIYENAEYIARDKPDATYHWVENIEASCRLLAINPELGQQRKTLSHGNCRSFVCGTFVIFFRGVSDGVEIIRILRGSRDLDSL